MLGMEAKTPYLDPEFKSFARAHKFVDQPSERPSKSSQKQRVSYVRTASLRVTMKKANFAEFAGLILFI
jgi:hypothetical protein